MKTLLSQLAKFGVVGIVATIIDFGIMNLLHYGAHLDILFANTAGFVVSLIFNYVASMKFVFEHKDGMSRRREFIIFSVLSAIGLGLNDLYMFIGVGLLNVGTMSMKLISTFFVTWYNYFSRRKFLDAGHA